MIEIIPIKPGPGQESVWDYPRPPRVEDTSRHIEIIFNGITIADSFRTKRVLETSHPPTYYIPQQDIQMTYLLDAQGTSFCEWKGMAKYYTIAVRDQRAKKAAWYYPDPASAYQVLKNHVAFYPGFMEACYVDGEKVKSQPGGFYGGWVTRDIVGPFKGEPGTRRW